ncbi:glycosyltransferase family 2 protein [Enterococcus faecium]|uniref:glycosyltransferase family 2 protein n=1 Tax=Enterococcus TaxID=1350 RepID=UPI000DEA3A98|nr:glycosyltransferase family 2 protein [Enterococcus faecium]MBD9749142.1 glycosyltransferase family 2 protein [Enterococcus faecium]RBT07472.1 hypothetical protein EA89_01062 [Enterococcus faecium]
MKPLISIIIPIYNVQDYLQDCLNSVLKIPYINQIEVILVNDGSKDESGSIAKEYAEKSKCFIYLEKENGGLSSARNYGLKHAAGEYIMYLDSDDMVNGEALKSIYSDIVSRKYDLFILSGKKYFDDSGLYVDYGNTINKVYDRGIEAYTEVKNTNNYFTGVYYQIVKKSVLDKFDIQFLTGILHEDHLYTFQIYTISGKTKLTDLNWYIYRIRPNSIMTGTTNLLRRFEGFSKTYYSMKNWARDYNLSSLEVFHHINTIKAACFKLLFKMSKEDLKKADEMINTFMRYIRKNSVDSINEKVEFVIFSILLRLRRKI